MKNFFFLFYYCQFIVLYNRAILMLQQKIINYLLLEKLMVHLILNNWNIKKRGKHLTFPFLYDYVLNYFNYSSITSSTSASLSPAAVSSAGASSTVVFSSITVSVLSVLSCGA